MNFPRKFEILVRHLVVKMENVDTWRVLAKNHKLGYMGVRLRGMPQRKLAATEICSRRRLLTAGHTAVARAKSR